MNELRKYWLLEDEIAFLNHGSFGACPKPVLQRQAELRERMEREPVRFFNLEAPVLLQDARKALGKFLHADPEDLVLLANATTGLNCALGSLPLKPGDELLITDHAYNATRNIATEVCKRHGARLVVARVPFPCKSPESVVESVLARVGDRTRWAVLDHVTSATGLIFPLECLVARLHDVNVQVIVDGAHAPGMLALDLEQIGADVYAGNCHKWLCAPKGAAFLHVPRQHQTWIRPVITSHGANARLSHGATRFRMEFDWMGTNDPTPTLAIPAAIEFMQSLLPGGWQAVRGHNRTLALEARRLLGEALEVPACCPDGMIGSLATLRLPNSNSLPAGTEVAAFDVDPLQELLLNRYRIEVPVTACPAHPQRMIRISAAIYNDLSDYERLAGALKELLGN